MSTQPYHLLFLTDRSARHQQAAIDAVPTGVAVTMLRTPERAQILELLPNMDFLVTERAGVIDAGMIAAGEKLQLIQRLGSLTYDIDIAAAQQRAIPVCYWPIEGCILVAEHMIMQMLALAKRLPEVKALAEQAADWNRPARRTDENTFAYNWSGRTNIGGIYGQTVGILGFGEIGAELGRRLRGFRPQQVLYYKRHRLPISLEVELGITYAGEDEIVAQSDFLCNLLPFAPTTEMHLNRTLFMHMKPTAFLVSCGSGSTIDETDLAAALQTGQLAGAALDTYEWEPLLPTNLLVRLAHDPSMNILLTPHTAAGALAKATRVEHSGERSQEYTNIVRLLNGQSLFYQSY